MSIAQIGGHHLGMPRHLRRLAVSDYPPLVQHGDAIGHCKHPIDVVFNEEYGMRTSQSADQISDDLAIRFG
jgi:hypothetical protein